MVAQMTLCGQKPNLTTLFMTIYPGYDITRMIINEFWSTGNIQTGFGFYGFMIINEYILNICTGSYAPDSTVFY